MKSNATSALGPLVASAIDKIRPSWLSYLPAARRLHDVHVAGRKTHQGQSPTHRGPDRPAAGDA